MLRAAIIGAQFAGQLSKRSLENVEVVWLGTSPDRFIAEVPALKPSVVIVDLAEFGEDADERLRGALERIGAELNIVTYSFARRALIRSLQSQQVRVLQSPITLEVLQAHLAPLVIRNVLQSARKELSMDPSPVPPRFSREQLGKLMEVASSVQCECPNHLAQVVERLQAFEAYSKDCENKNDADRAIHAALYKASAGARLEMEKALELLIKHENLTV
jgi:Ni,Fe-hydrogenase maturation factor